MTTHEMLMDALGRWIHMGNKVPKKALNAYRDAQDAIASALEQRQQPTTDENEALATAERELAAALGIELHGHHGHDPHGHGLPPGVVRPGITTAAYECRLRGHDPHGHSHDGHHDPHGHDGHDGHDPHDHGHHDPHGHSHDDHHGHDPHDHGHHGHRRGLVSRLVGVLAAAALNGVEINFSVGPRDRGRH